MGEKEQYARLGNALKAKTETIMTETVRKYVKGILFIQ